MYAHIHTSIYIWLLASNSHCFQLAFTPTLLCVPLQRCGVTSSLPLQQAQCGAAGGPRETKAAQPSPSDIAPAPTARSRAAGDQVQPLTLRGVVCPAQEGNCQTEVSACCSCAEWNAQRPWLGQVYRDSHGNKSHKLHSCLKFWIPDPQCKSRRVS